MTAAPRQPVADRLRPFGVTVFTEISRLALEHGAVNLGQGFPDFDGPAFLFDAAADAMRAGRNQYARMAGDPALCRAIAGAWRRNTGREIDPDAEVTVTAGCTEAIAAAILGLCDPGDDVILFEPFYDSYRACVAMAGATARVVTLRAPRIAPGEIGGAPFSFDETELRAAFTPRTRAVLVNTPHNPTGKVFSRAELQIVADLCVKHGAIAIADEVYERLVYEPQSHPHVRLATLPGMAERTITLSSLGKSFSCTGWKIGWAIAPPALSAAVRAAHQFLTFAASTPLQVAAVRAIEQGDAYAASLAAELKGRRDLLARALAEIGFGVHLPHGAYFIMADHSTFGAVDDAAFCRGLIEKVKVAAIPPSAFYANPAPARSLARFAFCKREETLRAAIERLGALRA